MNKELQEAYEAYIKHLSDYLSGIAAYLHTHGMGATDAEFELGKALRERIDLLKDLPTKDTK